MLSLIATLVVALAGSLRVLVRDSGRRFLPVFNIELVVACDDGSFGATVGMHVIPAMVAPQRTRRVPTPLASATV